MQLTPTDILTHWHTHGALWLMEEPDLIEKHVTLFAQTVAQCSDEAHHLPLLEDLVGYSYNTIRVAIAQNPHTPAHILDVLADQEQHAIRVAVLQNPRVSISVLSRFVTDTRYRALIFAHPHIPVSLLSVGAKDPNYMIRMVVAQNPHTPAHILDQLAHDESWSVREEVRKIQEAHTSDTHPIHAFAL